MDAMWIIGVMDITDIAEIMGVMVIMIIVYVMCLTPFSFRERMSESITNFAKWLKMVEFLT